MLVFALAAAACDAPADTPEALDPAPEIDPSQRPTPTTDRDALAAFCHATDGPRWTDSTNWLSLAPLRTWHGVDSDRSGRVTSLSLSGNRLRGEIPLVLGRLAKLESLNLSENNLTGQIPPELRALSNLTFLSLRENQLDSSIPPELGRLANLRELWLAGSNQLTGCIPEMLGDVPRSDAPELGLQICGATDPAAASPVDNVVASPVDDAVLIALYHTTDGSTGCVPEALGNVPPADVAKHMLLVCGAPIPPPASPIDKAALIELYHATDGANWRASRHWVSDVPLGRWYGVFTNAAGQVTELRLDNNFLGGKIPSELGRLGNLTELALQRNQLTGAIPPEVGNLANLQSLWLTRNQLSGAIPPELGRLANLGVLLLSDNQLSGPIPSELGSLGKLEWLDLDDNQLSGAIPPELGRLSSLKWLRLDGNQLSEEIPPELGEPANLDFLWLGRGNQFTGCIAEGLNDIGRNDLAALGLPFCGAN